MKSRRIGTAFLLGRGSQLVVRTTPGRQLQFIGGAAAIMDERDIPYLLEMPVQIEIEPEYAEKISGWEAKTPIGKLQHAKFVGLKHPDAEEPEPVKPKRGPGRPPSTHLWEPSDE